MPLPKSKAFWLATGITSALSAIIALDRYKLEEIRSKYAEEARRMGMQPAHGPLRKVTVIAFGRDAEELRKVRKLWKTYAVGLFTLAGCDYQMIEVNAEALDKELDKLLPTPDGEIPSDKPANKVVNVSNWITPTMEFWIDGLNNGRVSEQLQKWKNNPDSTQAMLYKLWEDRRPELKSRLFFDEGIVALDAATYAGIIEGTKSSDNKDFVVKPKLGHLQCDPPQRWFQSILNRAKIAENIGKSAMAILRDTPKLAKDGPYLVYDK